MFSKLCSGDLYGFRFSVPCSPTAYFDHEYGKDKWIVPLKKDYKWINMQFHSMWDDISWMYAVRLYSKEGTLRSDELAISWVAKRFNYTYDTVPSFLNVLPNGTVTLPPLKKDLVQSNQAEPPPKPAAEKPVKKQEDKQDEEEKEEEEKPKAEPQQQQQQKDEVEEKQEEKPIEAQEEADEEDEEDDEDEEKDDEAEADAADANDDQNEDEGEPQKEDNANEENEEDEAQE